MDVSIIETSGLGDLVSEAGVAVVIDPQRDIDHVLHLARECGVRIDPRAVPLGAPPRGGTARRYPGVSDARVRQLLFGNIPAALNIPLHELAGRIGEVPAGEVWVHCASGYRSSIAASMIDGTDRAVVLVDDSFEQAAKLGLTT